jgi:hypothetical protein
LGIDDGEVDILYNSTFIVNGDQQRVLVGASVIREAAKKFLYPCKPSKERDVSNPDPNTEQPREGILPQCLLH